jgi:hypothetical protein
MLIGDSFSFGLAPFVSQHFRHFVFTPAHSLDPELIDREKPEIVIQELVERKLSVDVYPAANFDPVMALEGN